jgi:putative phage-type endonuclease
MSREKQVKYLIETYGKSDQRTDAWHTKRGQMLTASEIYKGLADSTTQQRYELILSKLVPREYTAPGKGPKALVWGTQFEPIAKQIYMYKLFNHIDIVDLPCIPHPNVDFLGASPDGIIVTDNKDDYRYGKLVEFKCPISREFTENSPIPPAYFHQMQLQMECTGIDECEYIEMQFKELNYTDYVNCKSEIKSFFLTHKETGETFYKNFETPTDYVTWKEAIVGDNWEEYIATFWSLNNWRSVTVKHDPNWLNLHLPSLSALWAEVLEYRKSGTLPQSPKEKTMMVL